MDKPLLRLGSPLFALQEVSVCAAPSSGMWLLPDSLAASGQKDELRSIGEVLRKTRDRLALGKRCKTEKEKGQSVGVPFTPRDRPRQRSLKRTSVSESSLIQLHFNGLSNR